jgi:hypothetical protein
MMKRLLIVLAAVTVFAAGCANSSTSGVGSSGSSSSAAPGDSATPPSSAPSSDAAGTPSPGTSTKLTGTLEEGVEPNCVVLKGTGRDHVLIFLDQQVRKQAKFGDTVTVVGQARPTQMTTCQQGIPFIVSAMAVD